MWLMVPLSRQRAHRMASQAGILQFVESNRTTENNADDNTDDSASQNHLQHTGALRIRKKENNNEKKRKMPYLFVPLSAALRVSQRAVDQGMIASGSKHHAVVFSLDQMGDGGSPLMTLSLNPTRGQVRDRLKLKAAAKRHFSKNRRVQVVGELDRDFKDLKVGDGPIKAKVMRMSTRSGAAFVDCGVGRTTKDGNTRVLGMLRFDDLLQSALKYDDESAVEFSSTMSDDEAQLIEDTMYDDEDEEREEDDDDDAMTVEDLMFFADEDVGDDELSEEDGDEDITDLLAVGEDGVVSYEDPDTGKSTIISEMDVGSPSEDDESDTDSMFTGLSTQERLELLAKVVKDVNVEDSQKEDDNEEEEEMDITHLISTEDGVMSYKDPETGESVVISDDSLEDEDYDDDEDEDDLFKNMSPEERLDMISQIMNEREEAAADEDLDDDFDDDDDEDDDKSTTATISTSSDSYQPAFVQVGDEVEVYIKSVYKQSGRFMVTLDPSVQGRKAKDMKKESEAEKRLARLAEKLGGLERIMELEGTECDGVVQAISNTGDWCYVKPDLEDLPVGVAKLLSKDISLSKGDSVRVRMDGIDESRGQLAMAVI